MIVLSVVVLSLFLLLLTPTALEAEPVATPHSFSSEHFALPGGVAVDSSPVLADLDGDSIPEIIVGTTAQNGAQGNARNRPTIVVAMKHSGNILWSKDVGGPIGSSPAVGDINNDGQPEVVVTTGGDVDDLDQTGNVIVFDRNGNELWRHATADHYPKDGFGDGAFSSPTLCDVEGDGFKEIIFGGWDQRIYLFGHDGTERWFNLNRPPSGTSVDAGYFNADSIWSTAACADFNNDGNLEIVIGADITGGGVLPDGTNTQNGGFLYVFDKQGTPLVRRFLPETIYSSPAIGDLNGDGQLEIIVGTGWYWWNENNRTTQSYVYAFDTSQIFSTLPYADAAKLPNQPGWPQQTAYPGYSSPALADLDNDGKLDVVIGTGDPFLKNDDIPGSGKVYAWHHDGSLLSGWPVSPKNPGGNDYSVFSSPTIADIDNDGTLEILFMMIWDINVYNADGTFQQYLSTSWTANGSPAIGDTDGDKQMDIWVGSGDAAGDASSGHLWHYESSSAGLGATPWPMFHKDAAHSGLVATPARAEFSASEVNLIFDTNPTQTETQASLTIRNSGGSPLDWSASFIANQERATSFEVSVSPARGTLKPSESAVVNVKVKITATPLIPGEIPLGNLKITASSNGTALVGSPFTLPVTIEGLDLKQIYLPTIRR